MKQDKLLLAGRIVMSGNPGKEMGKIRKEYGISQGELAKKLGIKQSTLSDYEAGRRGSPGAGIIKRFVEVAWVLEGRTGATIVGEDLENLVGKRVLVEGPHKFVAKVVKDNTGFRLLPVGDKTKRTARQV